MHTEPARGRQRECVREMQIDAEIKCRQREIGERETDRGETMRYIQIHRELEKDS